MKNSNLEIQNPKQNQITKIQNLSESTRKVILWSVMVLMGLGLFTLYIKNVQKRLEGLEIEKFKEELQLPSFEKELERLPKIETPKIIEGLPK
jgi:hypothetical protein